MAPTFDSAVSSLLCAEENISIFNDINNDNIYGSIVDEFESTWFHGYHRTNNNTNQNHNRSFDDINNGDSGLVPLQSEECLALILEKETEHLPNSDYLKRLQSGDLDIDARNEAIDWIGKVHGHFGFGALCSYLSINYLDRFLSVYELPKGKAWMIQLLAVTCLSIAAKMEETNVPSCLDLQVQHESKCLFEAKTIQRMELLVLSTLRWRMQAITPFSFIDYFIAKINVDDNDHHDEDNRVSVRTLVLRSIQLIISTIKGIDFLEFKASEIAAAVAVSVVKTVDTGKAISILTQYVDKERVSKCIKKLSSASLLSSSFVPQSPIGVLDAAACLSYKSDDTTVGSCTNSSHSTPDAKRRKLNICCE